MKGKMMIDEKIVAETMRMVKRKERVFRFKLLFWSSLFLLYIGALFARAVDWYATPPYSLLILLYGLTSMFCLLAGFGSLVWFFSECRIVLKGDEHD